MRRAGLTVLLLATCCVTYLWYRAGGPSGYGVIAIGLLAIKIVMARGHKPQEVAQVDTAELDQRWVNAVVPVFNEDPQVMAACLESLLGQTRLPQSIVVVDDGSTDRRALAEARRWQARFQARGVDYQVLAFPVNRGKREAMIAGLDRHAETDLLLGIDSDTKLDRDAVGQLILPFSDPRTTVATGLVMALNYDATILSRLIDVRYSQAFMGERAAYSTLGSMLCACGSLAMYRADVVRKYKDDFLNQVFMGQRAVAGDDRRLTNYGLLEGRTVLQETAMAQTMVPERMGHFLRQQVRWGRSFFRESFWVVHHLPMRRPAFWLTLIELTWTCISFPVMMALLVVPFIFGFSLYGIYAAYVSLLAYARCFTYLEQPELRSWKDRWFGFALAPLYALLHVVLLVWLRLYALFTLRRTGWGTRADVEVGLERPIEEVARHLAGPASLAQNPAS
ncbi:MAG: glycosyltransferase [Propionibacteriaceae bacterium]|jgi:hyaluronan synthase|nr:glycosyltransferase [Propionibacteriaceae bacterium]